MKKHWMIVVAVLTISPASFGDEEEDKKEEQENKLVSDIVQPFLKAMKDKDIDAAMNCVSLPWLADDEKIIKDRDQLKKYLQDRMKKFDPKHWTGKVRNFSSYAEFQGDADVGGSNKKFIQVVGKVLQRNDRIVWVIDKEAKNFFYFLVRNQKDKISIASGPHRMTFLMVDNKIPNAEQIELASLQPEGVVKWTELGKTIIKDAKLVKKVVAEFKKGIDDSIGLGAACFNPRHRLKATYKGKTIELVICFECLQVQCILDGKDQKILYISSSPQKLFDKILKDAGVELATKPEK